MLLITLVQRAPSQSFKENTLTAARLRLNSSSGKHESTLAARATPSPVARLGPLAITDSEPVWQDSKNHLPSSSLQFQVQKPTTSGFSSPSIRTSANDTSR
jgi:hypothetical protein